MALNNTTQNFYGISAKSFARILDIFTSYQHLEKVVLFGSRANGTHKHGSDIDLMLYGNDLTHRLVNMISNDLDDSPIPYTVDLVVYNEADDQLVEHVSRVGKVIYRKGYSH